MLNRLYSTNDRDIWRNNLFLFIIPLIVGAFTISPSQAKPVLGKKNYSEVRVLRSNSLSGDKTASHLIGLHIKMNKGWKTYWRRPGDSGIPPFFDWKKSENLKSAKILWPAPVTLKDPYGTSIGYKTEVVFPVIIEAKDRNKPVNINLVLSYGACLEICIPEERKLSFQIPGGSVTSIKDHQLLMSFFNKVPKKAKVSEKNGAIPVINSVKSVLTGSTPHLNLKATFPDGAKNTEIFIEVSDGFFVPDPEEIKSKSNNKNKVYSIDLTKGDKVSDLIGKTITVTLVSDIGQSETKWVVQ